MNIRGRSRVIKKVSGYIKENPELLTENKKFPWSFLSGEDIKDLKTFCYFCGEKNIVDVHHVFVRGNGRHTSNELLPLCPNHHYMLHRGIADLLYHKGCFYLHIRGRKIELPYKINKVIDRMLNETLCRISYGDKSGDAKMYQVTDLSKTDLLLIGRKQNGKDNRGKIMWENQR